MKKIGKSDCNQYPMLRVVWNLSKVANLTIEGLANMKKFPLVPVRPHFAWLQGATHPKCREAPMRRKPGKLRHHEQSDAAAGGVLRCATLPPVGFPTPFEVRQLRKYVTAFRISSYLLTMYLEECNDCNVSVMYILVRTLTFFKTLGLSPRMEI